MECVEDRDKKIVGILDKKIAELTTELNALQPQMNAYKILTHQIGLLQRVLREFRGGE